MYKLNIHNKRFFHEDLNNLSEIYIGQWQRKVLLPKKVKRRRVVSVIDFQGAERYPGSFNNQVFQEDFMHRKGKLSLKDWVVHGENIPDIFSDYSFVSWREETVKKSQRFTAIRSHYDDLKEEKKVFRSSRSLCLRASGSENEMRIVWISPLLLVDSSGGLPNRAKKSPHSQHSQDCQEPRRN